MRTREGDGVKILENFADVTNGRPRRRTEENEQKGNATAHHSNITATFTSRHRCERSFDMTAAPLPYFASTMDSFAYDFVVHSV